MKFLQVLKNKTANLIKNNLLVENSKYTAKLVNLGMYFVSEQVKSLDYLMRQLILIQGLDPDLDPNLKIQLDFEKDLSAQFDSLHEEAYDKDFSWQHNKFTKVNKALGDLKLTENEFVAITDLQKFVDDPEKDNNSLKENSALTITAEAVKENAVLTNSLKKKHPKKLKRRVHPNEAAKKVNLQKAKDLVDKMIANDLLINQPEAIKKQIEEISGWSEDAFNAIKNVLDSNVNYHQKSKFDGNFKRSDDKKE